MEPPQYPQTQAPDRDFLFDTYVTAFTIWLELFNDVECWTDMRKRRAMLRARVVYQDAQVQYLCSPAAGIHQERHPWAGL